MIWIVSNILALYCVTLLVFILGWKNAIKKVIKPLEQQDNFYSILIPIRNEAFNLSKLFESLTLLTFPKDKFEVVFINDHSEDDSLSILNDYKSKSALSVKILSLQDAYGKKAALTYGVEKAKGKIIVTTDGDCIVPPNWLDTFDTYYQNTNTKMVFGPVAFHVQNDFFNSLQQIEFLSLIGAGAASLQLGIPNMCNGANMSFLKEVFSEVHGYTQNQNVPSGDDEFLMHAVYSEYPDGVHFNKSANALVNTQSSESFRTFFNQRKRWASKWNHYENNAARNMALFIGVVNFALIIGFGLLFSKGWWVVLSLLVVKCILEGIFIFGVMRRYQKPFLITHFMVLQICYPFYVILFGLASNFGSYVWKGRRP